MKPYAIFVALATCALQPAPLLTNPAGMAWASAEANGGPKVSDIKLNVPIGAAEFDRP